MTRHPIIGVAADWHGSSARLAALQGRAPKAPPVAANDNPDPEPAEHPAGGEAFPARAILWGVFICLMLASFLIGSVFYGRPV